MVGRLSIQKNPLLALQSLALLKELDWSFDIIGEGPLGPGLRAEMERLGLTNRVTFHGWLAGERVAEIMAGSDILLMTSLHEGLPMVGVEALQHGLAVIGSAIGGLQDIVEEGKNGFLCALQPAAFADCLRRVISDQPLLSALQEASRKAARRFDLSDSVDAYEKVLLDATSAAA
jgi:glycosyltransferase involved in cell wall biosynthesis